MNLPFQLNFTAPIALILIGFTLCLLGMGVEIPFFDSHLSIEDNTNRKYSLAVGGVFILVAVLLEYLE